MYKHLKINDKLSKTLGRKFGLFSFLRQGERMKWFKKIKKRGSQNPMSSIAKNKKNNL